MKKTKQSKQLSVSQQLRAAEADGGKVAKIINKAQLQINKILGETGHAIVVKTTPTGVHWIVCELEKEKEVPNG